MNTVACKVVCKFCTLGLSYQPRELFPSLELLGMVVSHLLTFMTPTVVLKERKKLTQCHPMW